MKKRFPLYGYALIFSIAFILERLTKWWAFYHLPNKVVEIFPGLRLILSWNTGISWSLFEPSTTFGFYTLSVVIFTVIVAFSVYTVSEYVKGKTIFFETLVLAGAVSNLIDRFVFGAVIDFIECYVGAWHFPVFNGADILVVGGIAGILIKTLWGKQ